MPIRMEEDPRDPRQQRPRNVPPRNQPQPNIGGGGRSPLTSLLPLLLGPLMKRPKLLIGLLILGAILYFMTDGCNPGGGGGIVDQNSTHTTGDLLMDEKIYDKQEVFEPLADNRKNPMPEKVSLLPYAPKRLNQGKQGSCVGWASAYAARTILHSKATGKSPDQIVFSPSYLYNQIALRGCQGAYLHNAMKAMQQNGGLPFRQFGYDERSCSTKPNSSQIRTGQQFVIKGSNRLTKGANNYKTDLLAIKQNLAQGAPVVIGMMVGGSFMQGMRGNRLWSPTRSDYNMRGFGGHAMCVIGYDDFLVNGKEGAFQIMNSWGPEWGENGVGWVSYRDFEYFTKEAYGLYPMGNKFKESDRFGVEFGLIDVNTKRNIALTKKSGNIFQTRAPIRKGDKFKIEVTNTIECYVYVFGQETDGSSYVLFPYTKKHSPYCGITGTRLFPRDFSMKADQLGNKDLMAIIVTKKPIDFVDVNKQINASPQKTYAAKIASLLGNQSVGNVNFKAQGSNISFNCDAKGKNAVGMIIEIDKR